MLQDLGWDVWKSDRCAKLRQWLSSSLVSEISANQEGMSCGLSNAFLEVRLDLPSRVGCLCSRHANWIGGIDRVREAKPMFWKQDLMQMLGGTEDRKVGGKQRLGRRCI